MDSIEGQAPPRNAGNALRSQQSGGAGSKSRTSLAISNGGPPASNRVMGPILLRLDFSAPQNAETPRPFGAATPRPVTTTLRTHWSIRPVHRPPSSLDRYSARSSRRRRLALLTWAPHEPRGDPGLRGKPLRRQRPSSPGVVSCRRVFDRDRADGHEFRTHAATPAREASPVSDQRSIVV